MFSQEELEKKKIENAVLDNMLDFMLDILPNDDKTDFLKSQHIFQKLEKRVFDKAINNE